MVRLLAVADEEDRGLTTSRLRKMRPDLVVSCGDLGPDYLDYVCSAANAPLLYVPGNHDPDEKLRRRSVGLITNLPPRPRGWNIDGSVVSDQETRFLGLGGSVRYRENGANQHTQSQMRRRVLGLIFREWIRGYGRIRRVDVFVAHSPPRGLGDADDPAHQGFEAFHRVIEVFRPKVMLHGHIHPHGFAHPDRQVGDTKIINVIPHHVVDVR